MKTTLQSLRFLTGLLGLSLVLGACSNDPAISTEASPSAQPKLTEAMQLAASKASDAPEPGELQPQEPLLEQVQLPAQASPPQEQTPQLQDQTQNGVLAEAISPDPGLSPQQWRSLSRLEIPIILPSPIPSGFEPVAVEADPGVPTNPMDGPSYSIRYQKGGSCFVVAAASGGFGGPVPEQSRPLRSALFPAVDGRDYQLYWGDGDGEGPFPGSTLFTDWMEGPESFYSLMSGDYAGADCDRISPDLAQQLVDDFTEVSPSGYDYQGETASADFDPYSVVGLDMLEAMQRLQQDGFRPVQFDEGKVRMTKGSMDAVLMLDSNNQRVTEVFTGESAATMCDPSVEQC